MRKTDPRIDTFIENAEEFAQPILRYLRNVVHDACPEVEETIKWGMPYFEYRGNLCHMAAFKQHCAFGFWKGSLILEGGIPGMDSAMGQFGRITSTDDLPPRETLMAYVKRAMELNEGGIKPKKPKAAKPELETPDDFTAALAGDPAALEAFESMSPGYRREYIEWIVDAKRDDTRRRRIEKAVEQLSEGKSLNWKYQ